MAVSLVALANIAQAQDAGHDGGVGGVSARAMVDAATGHARVIVRAAGRERAEARRMVPLRLTEGECVVLVGAATGASQVRVRFEGRAASVGGARPLANSRGEAVRARVCADVPGPYRLVVEADGAAEWAVSLVSDDRAQREVPDAGVTAPSVRVGDDRSSADAGAVFVIGQGRDYIAAEVRRFAQSRPPRVAITPLEREVLATNAVHNRVLTLSAGRCVEVVAAGVPSVADLSLELFDPTGGSVARDNTHRGVEFLRYCPTYGGRYSVSVRVFAGAGMVGVQALSEP